MGPGIRVDTSRTQEGEILTGPDGAPAGGGRAEPEPVAEEPAPA